MKTLAVVFMAAFAALTVGCNDNHISDIEGRNARAQEIKKTVLDLEASDPAVRTQAAQHLGQMKAVDRGAIDALASHLTDPNPNVRAASANSLQQIGTLRAIEKLQTAGRRGWPEARSAYDATVGQLRSRAAQGDAGARTLLDSLNEKAIPAPGSSGQSMQYSNQQYGMPDQQYPDDWREQKYPQPAQPSNNY